MQIRVGDAVAPTIGVFEQDRFRVLETQGSEARIRLDPPRAEMYRAMWVPLGELRHFYEDEQLCRVCGERDHKRCEPAAMVPHVGMKVRAAYAIPQDPFTVPGGMSGRVVLSNDEVVMVELDAERLPGLSAFERAVVSVTGKDVVTFFDLFEVVG